MPRQPAGSPPRSSPRARLLLLGAFGLGAAIGYAGGAQHSWWGLFGLLVLLIALVAAEALHERRRSREHAHEDDAPAARGAARPGKGARDLLPERTADKQRYLM